MVFGTFDFLHKGHLNFLRQAKKYGDYLIVVVARDKTVEAVKKHKPFYNEKERKIALEKTFLADKVVLGELKDKYAVIKKFSPDIIALGYDQKYFVKNLVKKLWEFGLKTKIVRLKPFQPSIYKSSLLRKKINLDKKIKKI